MKISDIKRNPSNPRIIKDDKFDKLVNSIREFPKMMALRPMVVDSNGVVLGGNMRLKALKELGYKDIPDEWVKRAEDLTEDEQRRFIIADNVGFGEHDWGVLREEWDIDELSDWGLDVPTKVDGDDDYTTKVESPIYKPTGEKPKENELYNLDKFNELKEKIDNSDIKQEIKTFLINAAMRHIVFDYRNIAEYYAQSSKDVQLLMEDSALVIIDYNKAIDNGFVKLWGELKTLADNDG